MAESQAGRGTSPPQATVANSPDEQAAASASKTMTEPVEESTTKKKSKKHKKRAASSTAATDASSTPASEPSSQKPAVKFTPQMVDSLFEANPALRGELGSIDRDQAAELLQKMNIADLLTGMSIDGKNQKDMASYKFWQTQPVPRFDDNASPAQPDGPIQAVDPAQIPLEPGPLVDGFEWCELDLSRDEQLKEVYALLTYHYVEDDKAMFRFDYSSSFLSWALKPPGWRSTWHVGVRASKSRKLVASIFGIPIQLNVRGTTLDATEINFLCIHKRLRQKRLAPLLIREVTRRSHLEGIYQGVYTGGVLLPKPVGTCRYFHRALDWLKLYEVGFSPLPAGSTKARMIAKNQLSSHTSIAGLRPMRAEDVDAVHDLLERYLAKFQMWQVFSREEIEHWLLNGSGGVGGEQTVWAYVVEEGGKITDLVSFYCLESTVIRNEGKTDGSQRIKAAYLFYYASEMAFAEGERGYQERLLELIGDALVEAKKAHFDVFNALTLHDNPLFLEKLRFGAGDGQLHYYLYNYRTAPISGGVDKDNMPDSRLEGRKGIGMVLL